MWTLVSVPAPTMVSAAALLLEPKLGLVTTFAMRLALMPVTVFARALVLGSVTMSG